jgi:hypothetical protein
MIKHGKDFARDIRFHPHAHITLASKFGLNLLSKSKYTIVDSTFDVSECKLLLTTLMGFHDGIALPCAYLLSNSQETHNYESFYRVCTKRL